MNECVIVVGRYVLIARGGYAMNTLKNMRKETRNTRGGKRHGYEI
jgi:hypothetical protein